MEREGERDCRCFLGVWLWEASCCGFFIFYFFESVQCIISALICYALWRVIPAKKGPSLQFDAAFFVYI